MTPERYAKERERLELTQEGAGEYFGESKRTGQRWAANGPPLAVAMAMLTAEDRAELDRLKKKAEK